MRSICSPGKKGLDMVVMMKGNDETKANFADELDIGNEGKREIKNYF